MTYKAHPLRVQRKRTKGYRMPEGAVYIGRPGLWGNPFDSAGEFRRVLNVLLQGGTYADCQCRTIEYRKMVDIASLVSELKGQRLACWCGLDKECHGDVLAEIANK